MKMSLSSGLNGDIYLCTLRNVYLWMDCFVQIVTAKCLKSKSPWCPASSNSASFCLRHRCCEIMKKIKMIAKREKEMGRSQAKEAKVQEERKMEGKERIPFHKDVVKARHPHPPILEIMKGLDISKFFSNWNFSLMTFSLEKRMRWCKR